MPEDRTTTLHPTLSLQAADREGDHSRQTKTRRLSEACRGGGYGAGSRGIGGPVGRNRCRKPPREKLDLNRILDDVISKSEKRGREHLRAEADALVHRSTMTTTDSTPIPVPSPIYQAYLVRRLNLAFPWRRVGESSTGQCYVPEENGRRVSRDLQRPRRATSAVRIGRHGVWDKRQLHSGLPIHSLMPCSAAADKPLAEFVKARIGYDRQYSAIRKASDEKKASLPSSGVAPGRDWAA